VSFDCLLHQQHFCQKKSKSIHVHQSYSKPKVGRFFETWCSALVSPDGVAPSRTVGVSGSVNLPLHHKVQKFSSGTSSPGWSRKKGRKMVVCVCVCGKVKNKIIVAHF